MSRRAYVLAPLLGGAACLLAGVNAVYLVGQSQQAVLLRLGQPAAVVNGGLSPTAAGLHLRWPFVDQVALLDRRVLELETPPTEGVGAWPTALQANLRYRIRDPLRFYRALGDGQLGAQRLSQRLQDSLDRALSGGSAQGAPDARIGLDKAVLSDLRGRAAGMGVEVLDAQVVDAAPPSSTVEAVSRRMQDAEARQASQIKADGEQRRRDLLAQADRDAADARGEGERQALETRGDGDAQRTAILGAAYGADPAFARFFRRLEAYDQAFNPDNTTLVLSPDNAFLDLFGHGPGSEGKPPG